MSLMLVFYMGEYTSRLLTKLHVSAVAIDLNILHDAMQGACIYVLRLSEPSLCFAKSRFQITMTDCCILTPRKISGKSALVEVWKLFALWAVATLNRQNWCLLRMWMRF